MRNRYIVLIKMILNIIQVENDVNSCAKKHVQFKEIKSFLLYASAAFSF